MAAGVPQGAGHVIGVLVEAGQFDASFDGDAVPCEVGGEDVFGFGLGQEQQERVGGVVHADHEQGKLGGAGAGVHLEPHRGFAVFDEGVGDAEPGEDFEGAGLNRQGAGLVDLIGLPVDGPEAGTEGPELRGEG